MSLYDGPRDVSGHLDTLESSFGVTGYRHDKGEVTGWRAERQLAEIHERELEDRQASRAPGAFETIMTVLQAWWSTVRQTG